MFTLLVTQMWLVLSKDVSQPLMCTLLVTQTVDCLVSGGEFARFLHSSSDTDVACFVPGCELAWFLMCTLQVTQMWPVSFQSVSWPGF